MSPDRTEAYEKLDAILAREEFQEYVSPLAWIVQIVDRIQEWYEGLPLWVQIVFLVLLTAVLEQGALGIFLVAVIVLGSLMAVVYLWRIVEAAWFRVPAEGAESGRAAPGEAPLVMLVLTWAAALSNIYFGLFTRVPRELATGAAADLLRHLP